MNRGKTSEKTNSGSAKRKSFKIIKRETRYIQSDLNKKVKSILEEEKKCKGDEKNIKQVIRDLSEIGNKVPEDLNTMENTMLTNEREKPPNFEQTAETSTYQTLQNYYEENQRLKEQVKVLQEEMTKMQEIFRRQNDGKEIVVERTQMNKTQPKDSMEVDEFITPSKKRTTRMKRDEETAAKAPKLTEKDNRYFLLEQISVNTICDKSSTSKKNDNSNVNDNSAREKNKVIVRVII